MASYVTINGQKMDAAAATKKYKPNILQRAMVALSQIGRPQRSYGAGIARAAESRSTQLQAAQRELDRQNRRK